MSLRVVGFKETHQSMYHNAIQKGDRTRKRKQLPIFGRKRGSWQRHNEDLLATFLFEAVGYICGSSIV